MGLQSEMVETAACRYGEMMFFKNDSVVSLALREYGEWAQNELDLLLKLVSPGDTVIDVGAFIGTHTLAFARQVGESGRVYAFEPQPVFAEVLRRNVAQNHLHNVEVIDRAVSDQTYTRVTCDFDISRSDNFGGALLSTKTPELTAPVNTSGQPVEIRFVALDDLSIQTCSLLKIDAENMEIDVLRGARETLHRTRCFISAECNNLEYGTEVLRFARNEKYEIFLLHALAFNPCNFRGNSDDIFNSANEISIVLVRPERMSEFRSKLDRTYLCLTPISTSDDLALGLIKKPQYKYEVLSQTVAAKTLGVDFWTNEPETQGLRQRVNDGERELQELESRRTKDKEVLLESHAREMDVLGGRYEQVVSEFSLLRQEHSTTQTRLQQSEQARSSLKAERESLHAELADLRQQQNETDNRLQAALAIRREIELESILLRRELELKSGLLDEIVNSDSWHLASRLARVRAPAERLRLFGRIVVDSVRNPILGLREVSKFGTMVRIVKSGLLDRKWYKAQYPDVAHAGIDPLVHYIFLGAAEGRDPNKFFDTDWYLASYPDVASAGMMALDHYICNGAYEGRDPSSEFDTDWYLEQNPDVRKSGLNPLSHFLNHGRLEGRKPRPGAV